MHGSSTLLARVSRQRIVRFSFVAVFQDALERVGQGRNCPWTLIFQWRSTCQGGQDRGCHDSFGGHDRSVTFGGTLSTMCRRIVRCVLPKRFETSHEFIARAKKRNKGACEEVTRKLQMQHDRQRWAGRASQEAQVIVSSARWARRRTRGVPRIGPGGPSVQSWFFQKVEMMMFRKTTAAVDLV